MRNEEREPPIEQEREAHTGNGYQPGEHASAAQGIIAEEAADAATFSDIVLFCHPRNISNLLAALRRQIEQAAGELPLRIIWSGHSNLLHQGVIVLEWDGIVTREFARQLAIDHEIFDFVIYDWTNRANEETVGEQQSTPTTSSLVPLFVREQQE